MATGVWEEQAVSHVSGICFKTGPPRQVGVELEWFVREREAAGTAREPVPLRRIREILPGLGAGGLPRGGRLTQEPGGQIELSSLPAADPAACVEAAAEDLAALRAALADAGLELYAYGLDPHRCPGRVLDHPRYRAMEAYFDRDGPWGRTMMTATAAVQISLDAGDEGDGVTGFRFRWELAHRLGPVLIAAFASSPLHHGRPTGWVSTRQAVWARMDPGRTRPPEIDAATDGDPRRAWAQYALDARLMCLRRPAPDPWTAPPDLEFRAWLRGEHAQLPRPTVADLDYHLSTLFPPVRPRGWLELRMIDAQPGDGWVVPLLVTAALMDDPAAATAAYEATGPLCAGRTVPPWGVWLRAARLGPADPATGAAVRSCFAAAQDALERNGTPPALRREVARFAERYPERGRCPADDLLDPLRTAGAGRTQPAPPSPKGAAL